MITVQFNCPFRDDAPTSNIYSYSLLDTRLVSNKPLQSLRCFRTEQHLSMGFEFTNMPEQCDFDRSFNPSISTDVQIYDQLFGLAYHNEPPHIQIRLDGGVEATVNQDTRSIVVHRSQVDELMLENLLLGPLLFFILAQRNIWLLHASSVMTESGVIIFAGNSAAGKSTLARKLSDSYHDFQLLADDMVAVDCSEDQPVCLPMFPQPKLATAMQPISSPAVRPIAGLFTLIANQDPSSACRIEQTSKANRAVSVINHMMGSNIPERDLQATMLEQGALLAGQTTGGEIHYSHRHSAIDEVATLLDAQLFKR